MRPKFPESVAYLGGLIRNAQMVKNDDSYELRIDGEEEFLDEIESLLGNVFSDKYRREEGAVVIDSPDAVYTLIDFFDAPEPSRRWRVTAGIRKGRERHKAAFLRGLFDGMGRVEKIVRLDYRWHGDDIEDISALLEELGIEHSTDEGSIEIEDVSTFMNRIGTHRPSRQRRAAARLAN